MLWFYIGIVASSYYPGRYVFWYLNSSSIVGIEEFEDTKGVIWIRISKKDRQHSGHQKKYKRQATVYKKHIHQTKDRVTRTTLKTGDELRCSVMNEHYGMLFNFQSFCLCGHLYFPQHPGRTNSRTHFNQ